MRSLKTMAVLVAVCAFVSLGADGCPSDQHCGDGVCEGGETAYSCPNDCDWCGNGICSILEGQVSCPQDCGTVTPICDNDGHCESGETATNCPNDCGGGAVCGDDFCESPEDAHNCYDDCGWCGDGYCSGPEDGGWCQEDCGCPWNLPMSCGGTCWNCAGGVYGNCCNGTLYVSYDARYPYYCPLNGLYHPTIGDLNYWCAGWEYYCEYVGASC